MSDIDIDIKLENHMDEAMAEFESKTKQALLAIGTQSVKGIVEYMSIPDFTGKDIVDTGRLRASISFLTPEAESGYVEQAVPENEGDDVLKGRSEPKTVIIGSNVNYAEYVNNGTTKQPARHFLENGIERERDNIQELVDLIYREGI